MHRAPQDKKLYVAPQLSGIFVLTADQLDVLR